MNNQRYLITLMKTTKPFAANLQGNLWGLTGQKEGKNVLVPADEYYKIYFRLLKNGIITIPLRHKGTSCLLAPQAIDLSGLRFETTSGIQLNFSLMKESLQLVPIKPEVENSVRKCISFILRKILDEKNIARIGSSKYSLEDLMKATNLQHLSFADLKGEKGALNYRRVCYFVSEACDDGFGAVITKVMTTVSLKGEQNEPHFIFDLLERYEKIRDYVVRTKNEFDMFLIRSLLDGRTYSPTNIIYRSPQSHQLPQYGLSLYEKLRRDYSEEKEKLRLVEKSKDDPYILEARPYVPGRRRAIEPIYIPPSTAISVVTLANREFYHEMCNLPIPWEVVTRVHPRLHFYGAIYLRKMINDASARIFEEDFRLDEPIYSTEISSLSRETAKKDTVYHLPPPPLLRRDLNGKVVTKSLTGTFREDMVLSHNFLPYIPLPEERIKKIGLSFGIISPKSEHIKASLLKQTLERSALIEFLFREEGKKLADSRRLLHYELIDSARSDLYLERIKETSDKYIGYFALIPERGIEESGLIFKQLKFTSTTNDIAIQPINIRPAFTNFDYNLWYAMYRKIGASVVGLDSGVLNVPKNFVITARDLSGITDESGVRYAALTSSVGPDMSHGYILAEKATVEKGTITNIYDILSRTKEQIWKRKMGIIPEAVVSIRDGVTPAFEHNEEIRFYEENGISVVTLDIMKEGGGKFLQEVMKTIEPYNVPLVATLLDGRTAIVQPHKIRLKLPPTPLKVKMSYKSGKALENFTIIDASLITAYSVFMTHGTPQWEYVKTPDVLAKAHYAADLYSQGALPTVGIVWIGHLD